MFGVFKTGNPSLRWHKIQITSYIGETLKKKKKEEGNIILAVDYNTIIKDLTKVVSKISSISIEWLKVCYNEEEWSLSKQ